MHRMRTMAGAGNEARHRVWAMAAGLVLLLLPPCGAQDTPRSFETPEAAVDALAQAVSAHDRSALRSIFGPRASEILNPDLVQATNEFEVFSAALACARRVARPSEARCVLEVGEDRWPFAVPIIRGETGWFYDVDAGREELLNRWIGRNELAVLKVMRAYVQAQREYASRDRDGDEVLEYAQRIASSLGRTDGLYWPTELNGEVSPLGPLVASAQSEGYSHGMKSPDEQPQPLHGYWFKVLLRQGKHAPGGRYDYVINGNMIGGFALLAWPVDYGQSGVMTFLVNQQGRVYQRDLGPKTVKAAESMRVYDPGPGWIPSRE